jgi:hypothetical protein
MGRITFIPRCVRVVAALVLAAGLIATSNSTADPGRTRFPATQRCFLIEIYVTDTPATSAAMKGVLDVIQRRTGVTHRVIQIDANAANRLRYERICALLHVAPAGRPVIYACGEAIVVSADEASLMGALDRMFTLTAFVRTGCPHCEAAEQHLGTLPAQYPALRLKYRDLTTDRSAAADLERLSREYRKRAVSVPVFHFCSTATTGKLIDDRLRAWSQDCRPQGQSGIHERQAFQRVVFHDEVGQTLQADEAAASLPVPLTLMAHPDEVQVRAAELPIESDERDVESIDLPLVGRLDARSLGLPLFTLAVGLVDGFNPCAMWVLLFLLSILVNLRDRAKIVAVAGTFVVISGLAYFAFMAAWLNVFRWIGLLRSAQVILGILAVLIGGVHVKDFFAFHRGLTLSIPDAAKPGIYDRVRRIVMADHLFAAIGGAATLAVLVNVVELLCTAGLPALYTEILTMRQLPLWQEYAYLGLYIAAYMFDDTLMVTAVVVTLGKRKLQEQQGRWLKLISGLVILGLGLLMIFKPEWLI